MDMSEFKDGISSVENSDSQTGTLQHWESTWSLLHDSELDGRAYFRLRAEVHDVGEQSTGTLITNQLAITYNISKTSHTSYAAATKRRNSS